MQEGALVLSAQDGLAALQMLDARTPDVILADVRMPGMDGLAFARHVKAEPRWRRVPIIAITGLTGEADLQATWRSAHGAHHEADRMGEADPDD